ncbi:hypothetical protein ACFS07_34650 [Undibacterium arcticum]
MSEVNAFDWSKQKKEIDQGNPLSPILIVRQDNGQHLLIADGFSPNVRPLRGRPGSQRAV